MMTGDFALHPRLGTDTHPVADWPLCRVLLMNDCRYPWLVLVPRFNGLREFHDLTPDDQSRLMGEITRASQAVSAAFHPDKINVGALGNMVEQLHVHVIARWASDPAWPGPVWGHGKAEPYAPGAEVTITDRLAAVLR